VNAGNQLLKLWELKKALVLKRLARKLYICNKVSANVLGFIKCRFFNLFNRSGD
jgi:hypothetical protein